jgi:hypothetical protein
MLTIAFSYFWTILFLMPLLAFLGPRSASPPTTRQQPVEKQRPHKTRRLAIEMYRVREADLQVAPGA